ncbi:MAG: thioredoxin family protein [Burkholderiaceae bacterium]
MILFARALAALLILSGFVLAVPPAARAAAVRVDTVEVELLAERTAVVPGSVLRLGLFLRHDPEWHTYWRNPGDSGLPTQFPLTMPDGFEAGEIQWPWPTRVLIPPLANFGFENDVLLMREVRVPAVVAGDTVRFDTLAQWLVCREVCVPGEAELSLSLPVAEQSAPGPAAALFAATDKRLPAPALELPARVDGRELRVQVPSTVAAADTRRIEYFPFQAEKAVAAADQRLVALADEGWRLEVTLAAADVRLEDLAGIIVIDDRRAVTISPQASPQPLNQAGETQLIRGHVAPFMLARADPAGSLLAAAGSSRAQGALPESPAAGPGPAAGAGSQGRPGDRPGDAGSGRPGAADGSGLSGAMPRSASAGASTAATDSLWLAMIFALIGGLILNLMPCVFPVIGLKVLGFAGHGGLGPDGRLLPSRRAAVRTGAIWFALGVIVSFWLLVAVLLSLRALGESVGWGFQLQSPVFVAAMALLFMVIGLNFSGVFEFGLVATRLGNVGAGGDGHGDGRPAAFAAGVLAVLVATPCTAPFMGSAIGFTLSQPALSTVAVFTALGLGMALPYLLLGLFPGWLRWLPHPGRWMETLRQFLAFPMYATAAWLAWVLAQQRDGDAVLALMLGAIVLACGLWFWGRQVQATRLRGRHAYAALALALVAAGIWIAWPAAGAIGPAGRQIAAEDDWQPWSRAAVQRALDAGHPVFVDFTAAWCVTCQVNKKLVLQSDAVSRAFEAQRVVRMVADWTHRDPAITAELASHGRNSVPLYLVFRPGQSAPTILPELLTPGLLLNAIAGQQAGN